MKKVAYLLLAPVVLSSCISQQSGSSSSASSFSSAPILLPPARRMRGTGTISFATKIHVGETSTAYQGKVDGLTFDVSLSKLPSVLSDLFDPIFYEDLLLDGRFYFDSLTYGSVQGKTSKNTTIEKSEIGMALQQGDLYLDMSDVERPSELSFLEEYIPYKVKVEKPFAHIDEYDPDIPLPLTDLPSLLLGAVDFDALEDYLDIRPYDPDTLKISYVLNQESIQALVDTFLTEEQRIDVGTYLPSLDPSALAFYYNLPQSRLSRLDLKLGFDLDLGKYVEELASYIDPIHWNMDVALPVLPIESVTPRIEGEYGTVDFSALEELFARFSELAASFGQEENLEEKE